MLKKVLVTGAAGLLGKAVCKVLAENQYQVIAIVRPGSKVTERKNITFLEADLSGDFSISTDIGPVEAIFHLAQAGGHADFIRSAGNISGVTISTSCRLAEYACANGIKKIIFASSGGVYGGGPHSFAETAPLSSINGLALNFYLESKKTAENLLAHFSSTLEITILRPFFIYGPNQKSEMLFPRLKKSILEGKEITISGEQGTLINPIHVEDAAKAVAICIEGNKPKIINISGNEVISIRKICELLGNQMGITPIFKEKPEPALNFIGDNTLMKTHLYAPEISIVDGLLSI